MTKKILVCLFSVLLLSLVTCASELMQMGGAGIATLTGLDAVLYNPAAVTNLKERYVGGSYAYTGANVIAIGYLEPGLSDRYSPNVSNFRLAGGITWVRDATDAYKDKYYYTVGLCTEPVYGGVNLIYKRSKGKTDAFGMDVAIGTRFLDKFTTTLAVENLVTWAFAKQAAFTATPHIRFGVSYGTLNGFLASLDASTKLQNKADISLGAAYRLKSFAFKGGITLMIDTKANKVTPRPGLGFSYKSQPDSNGAFNLDLALSYIDGKVGHSASFGYTFN